MFLEHMQCAPAMPHIESGAGAGLNIYGMKAMAYGLHKKNEAVASTGRPRPGTGTGTQQQPRPERITRELVRALQRAILDENLGLCDQLIIRGCNVDMELTSDCCCGTPLVLALAHRKPKAVQWLLARNASTTKHAPTMRQAFAPIDVMIRQSAYNTILPAMLDHFRRDGGSILVHVPSLISAAVETGNNLGLETLLRQAKKQEGTERSV